MRLFIKILAGLFVVSAGVLIWLVFSSTDEVVRLTNYIRTMPARNARHTKSPGDEVVEDEVKNPSTTKPGSEGDEIQPVTDQSLNVSTDAKVS